jgi:hypothetical protein
MTVFQGNSVGSWNTTPRSVPYLTIAYLRGAGIDPTTVKLLDMSPNDAVAAWIRGDIDAARAAASQPCSMRSPASSRRSRDLLAIDRDASAFRLRKSRLHLFT